ncbi:MAG TPA: DUF2950 domain-containing protein [Verrucomicrobiae bacterium]|jgi:hypothetical protein|nr:DUF2950 domain-containing protein [Verrucomicrobiae bacterium]
MNIKSSLLFRHPQAVRGFGFLLLGLALSVPAAEIGKTFETPEQAVSALIAATRTQDNDALHALFGPEGDDLENPDRVQSTNELSAFTAAYNQTNRLARLSDTEYVLEVGADLWPFPVPLEKKDGRWFFDTETGKDELLGRRIGQNELSTLEVMRNYVDAQREYATKDRDGDEVLEYAQRIASSPGQTDGLYWAPELNGELSPLGPLVAEAQGEGYFTTPAVSGGAPQPFHGYLFKILTGQGGHAPGGKYDFIVNGNMILGFALIAWPAEYGTSGVMTFIVNQQGRVYQKDLGSKTAKTVEKMHAYDPDPSWQVSPD